MLFLFFPEYEQPSWTLDVAVQVGTFALELFESQLENTYYHWNFVLQRLKMPSSVVKEGLLTESNCAITEEQLNSIIRRGQQITDFYEQEKDCFAR